MTTKAKHAPDCATLFISGTPAYSCGGTYTCNRCEREFGWCLGAVDDTPALCDECANAIQESCAHAAPACDTCVTNRGDGGEMRTMGWPKPPKRIYVVVSANGWNCVGTRREANEQLRAWRESVSVAKLIVYVQQSDRAIR